MGSSSSLWITFYTSLFYILISSSSRVQSMGSKSGSEYLTGLVTLDSLHNVSILRDAIRAAHLEDYLFKDKTVTLFAPNNAAFESAFESHSLTCVHAYYLATPCKSRKQLLESTNLRQLLLDHVVIGDFPLSLLEHTKVLQFDGDAVAKVENRGGHTYIGKSLILKADIEIENGVVHIIDKVLGSIDPITLMSADVSINASSIISSVKLADADFFNTSKREEMAEGARLMNIPGFQANRGLVGFPDGGLHDPSILTFDPSYNTHNFSVTNNKFQYPVLDNVKRPLKDDDIAFMTVLELGDLIRTKQVTSQELVKIFLSRLKRYNCVLQVVISYTEKLAYEEAAAADHLLQMGTYLGPLHGIPYGLKDIIAVPNYRTTWGSGSFKNQVINKEAWVYQRLKKAGAVLVAKLVCGSLAYDDIWFGGRTRNPWNIEEFSTGSSSGPAASTSAGLLPFAIGSETAGSITYPSARCGVTAHRPTFGLVGRSWVLSLEDSLDKLGPFCRSARDCAIILDIIRGKDPDDISSKDVHLMDPFAIDISNLTVGYLEDGDKEVVKVLASKGVRMVPFNLSYTVQSAQSILNYTMDVGMLSHFDHWQRAGLDDLYEAQDQWPLELRRARLIPAVDYIQAQRARGKLIREIKQILKNIDAFIGNATDWEKVAVGNIIGMPIMVIPTGLKEIQNPPAGGTRRRTTVTTGIYGAPYHDSEVLALAMAYQDATKHHLQRPPIDDLEKHDFHLEDMHCPPVFGVV
eukprot:c19445_g2_i1 orf=136-2379(-)